MVARVQEARVGTNNTPPANGSLLPGQLYLEMGTPARLWAGVPTSIVASGLRLLVDADAQTAVNTNSVLKSGATMTGLLVLSGDPGVPLGAATKQYADAKLALAGGTLTGPLLLAADPAAPLGAATKQYADAKLPLAGGTLTGALTLAADPAAPLGAATKQYVDTKVGSYLPLAGGTLTGNLTVNTRLGVGVAPIAAASPGNVASTMSTSGNQAVNLYHDGSNWRYWNTGGGALMVQSSAGLVLYGFATGAGGAVATPGANMTLNNAGRVDVNGTLNGNAHVLSTGAANPSLTAFNTTGYAGGMWCEAGGTLAWGWCDGVGVPNNTRLQLDRASNLTLQGSFTATGALAGSYIRTTGAIMNDSGIFYVANNTNYYLQRSLSDGNWRFVENSVVNGTVQADGSYIARGSIAAGGTLYADQQIMVFGPGGGGRIMQFQPNFYFDFNTVSGVMSWFGGGSARFWSDPGGNFAVQTNLTVGAAVTCASTGIIYANIGVHGFNFRWDGVNIFGRVDNAVDLMINNNGSDARMKQDIEPSSFDCLDALMRVPLYEFRWRDHAVPGQLTLASPDKPKVPVGFISQRLAEVFPEAAVLGEDEPDDTGAIRYGGVETNVLLATLVGAMQQMSGRLAALEKGNARP